LGIYLKSPQAPPRTQRERKLPEDISLVLAESLQLYIFVIVALLLNKLIVSAKLADPSFLDEVTKG
jgi:hypothetical protein